MSAKKAPKKGKFTPKAPPILNENQPLEFFLLQQHCRFDEIESILLSKCYQTEQVKKAREFLSLARHYAAKAFSEDAVQKDWLPAI